MMVVDRRNVADRRRHRSYFQTPRNTSQVFFIRQIGQRNVESPGTRVYRRTRASFRRSWVGKGAPPCVVLDVQNRAHPCAFVALQIFAQTVNSSEICDHFLATSDAVQVDLNRIPLATYTIDDVDTEGKRGP